MAEQPRFYEVERLCEECGELFWGTAGATCCSSSCRSKRWRAKHARTRSVGLAEVCEEVLRRREAGSASFSKLLPRLFRQVAVELSRRGWDPIELLISSPDEPATEEAGSPGGTEGTRPARRRWLHPPERELELLRRAIAERRAAQRPTEWHERRLGQLEKLLAERA